VRLRDAGIGEQERHRTRTHRGTAVGVKRELIATDPLLVKRLGDEPFGKHRRFAMGDHPADDVAAVDVQDLGVSPTRCAATLRKAN
jgi:hypothetical protein